MSTELVVAGGLVTYQGSGLPTLDATIVETMNRDDVMPDHKQYMGLLDIKEEKLLNPNQTYSAKAAPKGLKTISETGIIPTTEMIFTPKKGVAQVRVGNAYERSEEFTEWARVGQNIAGAPDAIQAELLLASSQVRDLGLAYDIRCAEEMVKVLTKGFSITASAGPGSATPKGKALFDTHTYGVTGQPGSGTFANFTNGVIGDGTWATNSTNIAAGTTRLQTLINQLKAARDENGKFVRQVNPYKLYVSRIREVFWKVVLNNESKFSGQGTNAMQENQFLFDGNIVEIVALDILGQPDTGLDDGSNIGTTDMIFVTNSGALKQSGAYKFFRLTPLKIDSWVNQQTKVAVTDGRAFLSSDHYGLELYVSGSTCA